MNIGKTIRKFRRNTRAISPVIATLLMIAIQIQTVNQAGGVIYVQNVGTSTVKFSNLATGVVYIDGVAKDVSTTTSGLTSGSLATTKTAVFTLPAASIPISSGQHTIKIVADDGTFNELTKTYP
jgi:archaellum component FlaG (FlaF/FlaG flagellin family)